MYVVTKLLSISIDTNIRANIFVHDVETAEFEQIVKDLRKKAYWVNGSYVTKFRAVKRNFGALTILFFEKTTITPKPSESKGKEQ